MTAKNTDLSKRCNDIAGTTVIAVSEITGISRRTLADWHNSEKRQAALEILLKGVKAHINEGLKGQDLPAESATESESKEEQE